MDESDYLYEAAVEQWPNILKLYSQFEKLHPILVFELHEQRICAYSCADYKSTLSPRSARAQCRGFRERLLRAASEPPPSDLRDN